MIMEIAVFVIVLMAVIGTYFFLNKPTNPRANVKKKVKLAPASTGTGTTSPAGAGVGAQPGDGANPTPATPAQKWWGWMWVVIFLLLFLLLVGGVFYGGKYYGSTHSTPPPRWAFQYKRLAGEGPTEAVRDAKITRFDEIGGDIIFDFEVYFPDKDCGNHQTIFFEYDTRKGKTGRYYQDCPADEGTWNYYQVGSRFNGTLKSNRLGDELLFELYRTQ
ncbi:MAG: hypothetical protein A2571_02080 [Candidatus Vogelbacteria bacterium RIFOXYD1_FULL_44_32]|uniref:Uncharacterized protein n=1 Tax=Candidatus Vogelbacteria bacterium RIFOXYD1_FULL_44_32 TaxID=1802438 RepID=A0A1G2QEW3_9BACT|nr:MAG: hypothetical protein A2571_02080 [Candidatus Vogelbacteria bacterium RIFOXYD1_FULL_44_32]